MHHAKIRKNADLIGVFALEHIFVLVVHSLFVPLVSRRIDRLRITEAVHQEDHFLLLDLFLLVNCFLCIFKEGAALHRIFFLQLIQIVNDDSRHFIVVI